VPLVTISIFFGAMPLPSTLYHSSQYNKGKESEKKVVRIKLTIVFNQ